MKIIASEKKLLCVACVCVFLLVGNGAQSWATLSPAGSESPEWFYNESPALWGPVKWAEPFCPNHRCSEPPLRFSQTPLYQLFLKLLPKSTITHIDRHKSTSTPPPSSSSWFLTCEKWRDLTPHLDVFQPMCGLEVGQPVRFFNIRINDLLQFPQWLTHYMNVMDFQKHQFCILISIFTLKPPSFHLIHKQMAILPSISSEIPIQKQSTSVYLVSCSIHTGSGIEYEEFVWLCICIHNCLQKLLILFAAPTILSNHGLTGTYHCSLTLWMDPWQHLYS